MANEFNHLFSPFVPYTSRYSTFATQTNVVSGFFFPGVLIPTKAGLVTKFRFWGTAIQMEHPSSFGLGSTYKVSIDGGAFTTYTGTGVAVTKVWATGLAETWHTVEIRDFSEAGGQFTFWGITSADMLALGFAGQPDSGLRTTYTALAPGYLTSVDYQVGWGPVYSPAELNTALAGIGRVSYGSTSSTHPFSVEFSGRVGETMAVKILDPTEIGTDPPAEMVLYTSTPKVQTPTLPCPYDATIVTSSVTGDADGFVSILVPAGSTQYYLAVGNGGGLLGIVWQGGKLPNAPFANAVGIISSTFIGDSLFAAGNTGVIPPPASYAQNAPAVYAVKAGNAGLPVIGHGVSGSRTVCPVGNYDGLCSTARILEATSSPSEVVVSMGWVNDLAYIGIGAFGVDPWTGYVTPTLITAAFITYCTEFILRQIVAARPDVTIFQTTSYVALAPPSGDALVMKGLLEALITTLQGEGKAVYPLECHTWGYSSAPLVSIPDGIHMAIAGLPAFAEHLYSRMALVLPPLLPGSITALAAPSAVAITSVTPASAGNPPYVYALGYSIVGAGSYTWVAMAGASDTVPVPNGTWDIIRRVTDDDTAVAFSNIVSGVVVTSGPAPSAAWPMTAATPQ